MEINGKTVKEYEVYKNDSILLRHLEKNVGNEMLISFKATDVNDIEIATMPPVVLSAIRLFSSE